MITEYQIPQSEMSTSSSSSLFGVLLFGLLFHSYLCSRAKSIHVGVKHNVLVRALSTQNKDLSTNMNIVTYTSPMSLGPNEIWSLSLFKNSLSLENFERSGKGVLQQLIVDQLDTVPILGKMSGRHIDKLAQLKRLGHSVALIDDVADVPVSFSGIEVMERCPSFICLERLSRIPPTDVGDHWVYFCKNVASFYHFDGFTSANVDRALYTDTVRRLLP